MATNSTVITRLPKGERRAKLAQTINECDGRLLKVAHRLRVHRDTIYEYAKVYDLWPVINAVRKDRLEKERAERAKKYRGGTWV